MLRMTDIIAKKRDGLALTEEEIRFFVKGAVSGGIPDYQTSALLMAICLKDLNEGETLWLTQAMMESGDVMDLSSIPGIKVDKHSTGGVGDKTTLILGPIVASLGVPVAKMSGRGLGHTGGTIDKLEAIPGFNTQLTREAFLEAVKKTGIAVVGQTGNLAPADKKLYALRDVTATVNHYGLIASSIMSKKLAAGADAIVLDVKVGSGAFMKTVQEARKLARIMVDIGRGAGRKTAAVITDMDKPLGKAIGNALEIREVLEILSGKGPEDLRQVCLVLAARMLELAGRGSYEACLEMAQRTLEDGSAKAKFREMIKSQGGLDSVVNDPGLLPLAVHRKVFKAEREGFVTAMISDKLGIASVLLGAGRETKESVIEPSAGLLLLKKPGDRVETGEALIELHANDESLFKHAGAVIKEAVVIGDKASEESPLILDYIG